MRTEEEKQKFYWRGLNLKVKKVVHTKKKQQENKVKKKKKKRLVSYTYINGLVSTLSEINDYLRTGMGSNTLDAEGINARNIHDFKSKLDNSRF